MKKTIVYTLIALVLIFAVSCASTTRVDELEFDLSEKEVGIQTELAKKTTEINKLLAELEAATARIEELETTSLPNVNSAIENLEAVVPVGEKRIATLESVVPVGEKRIQTLESYLPLYYGVIGFFQEILPLQQKTIDAMAEVVDANQAIIDAFVEAGFSAEY